MKYDRIPYSSFMWKFGTTSFRTKEFNYKIERQLSLLDEFWKIPENKDQGWEKKYMAPGQTDIYGIKVKYYDFLVGKGFMEGGESWNGKYKTAREKTSGLYDMGLIDENHRLTEVGYRLLDMAENMTYKETTPLGIPQDSYLYLGQLLKLNVRISGNTVRPLIVTLRLLSEFGHLTYDEFCYLLPLCINSATTSAMLEVIHGLRVGTYSVDEAIIKLLLTKDNYDKGLKRFRSNDFSENLLLSISMNRKSPTYDKPYVTLYEEMHAVYLDNDMSRILPLAACLKKFQSSVSSKWKRLMFKQTSPIKLKNDPTACIVPLPAHATATEEDFKEFFFITMHLFKAKATLEDYFDLNRRYLGLTNCFIFDEETVKLDIVPKHFFNAAADSLYGQAFTPSTLLEQSCNLSMICPALTFDEQKIISGISRELGTEISTMDEAFSEVEKLRYARFDRMISRFFSDKTLIRLLDCFDRRDDDEITRIVTDNADVPTIFEYVLGIIWYKASGMKGRALDYMKLSLDANLLPVTHAAGGEADIVWEYNATAEYPAHSLLLEATLTDKANQRRMEMEPVSRHLGNHLLKTKNHNSYCVFVANNLNVNVIGDFKIRKNGIYCDTSNPENFVDGMKIIPLCTEDIREILKRKITYEKLYRHFAYAYKAEERHPQRWYDGFVNMTNAEIK